MSFSFVGDDMKVILLFIIFLLIGGIFRFGYYWKCLFLVVLLWMVRLWVFGGLGFIFILLLEVLEKILFLFYN